MSMARFAQREAIKYSTFAGWMAKAGPTAPAKPAVKFAEVRLPSFQATSPSVLEVRLPDGTVVCGGRVGELVALVRALRS
jgi:hypothetical protein